jgi:hypothetical protein
VVASFRMGSRLAYSLQEWWDTPTAKPYAEGFLSGPSAYGLAGAAPEDARRRTLAVGVEDATPRAAVGVNLALGVGTSVAAAPSATRRRAHGVRLDAEGYPRHRVWPPYADGHPRHIGFFSFFLFFSLILLYIMFLLFIY